MLKLNIDVNFLLHMFQSLRDGGIQLMVYQLLYIWQDDLHIDIEIKAREIKAEK